VKLRGTDPEEALRLLAEGDRAVQPLIDKHRRYEDEGLPSKGTFAELTDIDLLEALGHRDPEE
jgi:hypothetical protein